MFVVVCRSCERQQVSKIALSAVYGSCEPGKQRRHHSPVEQKPSSSDVCVNAESCPHGHAQRHNHALM